jgi:phosphoenolpyruvate-protein phosphotransferase (PTS system enzyme I)
MRNMEKEILLQGTPLTEGVVAGKICLYQEDVLQASPRHNIEAADVPVEIERFQRGIAATKKDLQETYDKVIKKLGPVEAEIFTAHIMILEDKAFNGQIAYFIKKDLVNTEYAVIKAIEFFEEKFRALPEDYFRERIQDISDLSKRLIRNLGLKHTGLLCAADCGHVSPVISSEIITPTLIAGLENRKIAAILSEKGSKVSHGSILARALGLPAVIGVDGLMGYVGCGTDVLVDADSGKVFINPSEKTFRKYESKLKKIAEEIRMFPGGVVRTKDGTGIRLFANAGTAADITNAAKHGVADIGLFRTEFLFLEKEKEPTVEEQAAIYRNIIESTAGTVTFRLLDIGGDKILDFLRLPEQDNPNLGLRGVRIYDMYPEIISNQIKALLIAKGGRPVKIMVPMVSTLQEFRKAKALIILKARELAKRHGVTLDNLKIGCMVEVPSAVYLIEYLAEEADFLSVGTNDLIQYLMGTDRGNAYLTDLSNPLQPAVLKALSQIVQHIRGMKKELVVCGEMASDPELAKLLIGCGYRALSVNPNSIEKIGWALSGSTITRLKSNYARVLNMKTLELVSGAIGKGGRG